MSADKYPRIGSARQRPNWKQNPKTAPVCIAAGCSNRATHRIDVEVNWFRGDDEVGNACELHRGDASAVLHGIEGNREKQDAERLARAAGAQP